MCESARVPKQQQHKTRHIIVACASVLNWAREAGCIVASSLRIKNSYQQYQVPQFLKPTSHLNVIAKNILQLST
jgi:hypothetical protein